MGKNKSVRLLENLKSYDVYFSVDDGCVCFEVTDGDHDMDWKLNQENSLKLLSELDIVGKMNDEWQAAVKKVFEEAGEDWRSYVRIFEEICEQHGVKYEYSSWIGGNSNFFGNQ